MRIISRQQSRELDRRAVDDYGMTGLVLMENAGRGVADTMDRLEVRGRVVVCCGAGNNGGDGFVVARHLDLRGHDVCVVRCADAAKLAGDALANDRILAKSGVPILPLDLAQIEKHLSGASWIVDALLGTGATGEPRSPFDAVIDAINACQARVLAVDVPSGLDCDSGEPAQHTVKAAHTCTFVAAKPGFLNPAAAPYLGTLHVLDIGAPRKLVEEILRA